MNTDSRNQKRDLISGIMKVTLAASFVFLLVLLLIGENISNTSFIISNRILFLIAVLVVTGICALRVRVKGKWIGFIVKHENLCVIMVSAILLMVQLVIVYETIFQTSWDVVAVWYGSHWAALRDIDGITEMSEYFSIYPNNLFLVFIFSSILKLNMVLGEPISNGGMLLAMVQCLLINVTGVLVYKCARNYAGIAASWGIYLVYAILIGTSGWIVLPYSDGMGIIFPTLLLYLYIRFKHCMTGKGKYLYWAALFVVGVVAYHVKPFTVIVLIAVMLIELIRCFIKLLDKSCQKRVKSWVICGIIMVLSVLLCSGIISSVNHSLGFRLDRERELGIPHYLMMGVNRDTWGGYSYDDMEFGREEKKEERNREEWKEFSRRIHEMGLSGYGELFVHKASKSFLDGTFGWGTNESFYTEIYPVRGNSLCEILRSWYYGFESLYPYNAVIRQLLWIIVLILVPFAAYKKSILRDDEKVLFLAVLGFMLYLQIFESHARYVFVFAPLFMILAFIGGGELRLKISEYWKKFMKVHNRQKEKGRLGSRIKSYRILNWQKRIGIYGWIMAATLLGIVGYAQEHSDWIAVFVGPLIVAMVVSIVQLKLENDKYNIDCLGIHDAKGLIWKDPNQRSKQKGYMVIKNIGEALVYSMHIKIVDNQNETVIFYLDEKFQKGDEKIVEIPMKLNNVREIWISSFLGLETRTKCFSGMISVEGNQYIFLDVTCYNGEAKSIREEYKRNQFIRLQRDYLK